MTKITALTVENLDLLHQLDDAAGTQTITQLALSRGRDQSNLTKTLKRLREEGTVQEGATDLTDAGRSVTRLFTADGEILADDATLLLKHADLLPDPDNARTSYDTAAIADLADDINARSRPGRVGLIHALTVLPPSPLGTRWRMRGGYRRWLAIEQLIQSGDLPYDAPIPCVRHDAMSDRDAFFMGLVENLQREDLHPLDEGAAYARGIREFELSLDGIAAGVRKSKKHVADRIALVDKLPDELKARMRLPVSDDSHLTYAAARKEVQALNARPKPAIDVTPKEALVLLEIEHRWQTRPSHDGHHPGAKGWVRIEGVPAGGAAASLVAKGLIEVEDGPAASAYVRFTPARALELGRWIAERDVDRMALWHARAEVVGGGLTSDLEAAGRYATPWLNDPIIADPDPAPVPPPTGPAPSAPPASPVAAQAEPASPPPPPDSAGEGSRDWFEREVAKERAGPGSDPLDPDAISPALQRLAGVPAPAEPPQVDLTEPQAMILLEVAHKTLVDPIPGRVHPDTGRPAFIGCTVTEYWNDTAGNQLISDRLIKFVPSAKGPQIAVLTGRGEAWVMANGRAVAPPYRTAWLNPKPADPAPHPQSGGGGARSATEGAAGVTFWAKPTIAPDGDVRCGNCEETFELSTVFDDEAGVGTEADHRFVSMEPGERAECPHCKTALRIARVEVFFTNELGHDL